MIDIVHLIFLTFFTSFITGGVVVWGIFEILEVYYQISEKKKEWIKSLDDKTYRKYMEMRGF